MNPQKNKTNISLTNIVPEYHSAFSIVRNLFWNRIRYAISFGHIESNKKILDVGCGAGYLAHEIRKKNKKCFIIGIDININIYTLSIAGCEFRVEDVTELSFADNYFDVVYALDTLEHVKEVSKAVQELKRCLKTNGELIISGPTETLFYKFCRFLIKGTLSEKTGPGAGAHYHTIDSLDKEIIKHSFIREKRINLPRFSPFPLQKVIKYKNIK
jgi:ubiquinone/menaquinone biosynthesis C-methylase UbiE